MHKFFSDSSNVPAFLIKLWKLVEDPSTDDLITWNHNGSSFIISDSERFASELLPQYFKHSNNASFVRQLNIYGFRKVINYGKIDSPEIEFQHAFFSRDKVELLTNIKRKSAVAKTEVSFSAQDILTNLTTLREKQRAMDTTLTKMKKENELLWRELSTVRQRHKAQEQVLHKVIQFLVQIIQRSNQSIHVPRKLARMLQDNSVSQENSSHVARIVDALRNKDNDCIIVPEESSSPLGAVIHEVTDFDPDSVISPQSSPVNKFNTSILKPLTGVSKNSSICSCKNASSSEPLSVLENLHNRVPNSGKKSTSVEESGALPMKYVAVPVEGDPNKLILVPADNFTSEELSSLKADSICNVIAIPEKETASDIKIDACDTSASADDIACDLNFHFSEAPNMSDLSDICTSVSSKHKPCDFSMLKNDFDDSVLSDLLQASKISSIEEECDQKPFAQANCEAQESLMDEEIFYQRHSMDSSNNQVAIPGPSSIVKSTKNCYPDFSILQDSTCPSSPNMDIKILEQLFSADDASIGESFLNQLPTDVHMSNPSDDIMGNELVQFTPTILDEDVDNLRWFDFLNHEPHITDNDINPDSYFQLKDTDKLIEPNTDAAFSSALEVLKKEAILTSPQRLKSVKNTKRRKLK